jgi:hypothetical protein
MQYRVYNTGDKVWLSQRFGAETVVKVVTHDGLVWSEESPRMTQLEGAEKFIHKIEVFFTKLILKVLA